MTDESIAQELRCDGENGIRLAMERYGGLVKSVIAGFVASETDREEIFNDVFYKLWRCRYELDVNKSSLKNYLCIIARNTAIDRARFIARRAAESLPDDENDLGIEVDYEDETAKRINMKIIAESVGSMRSPDREVFIERYYFRRAVKEIADKYDLKPKKVENILSRGRKKLKKALIEGGIIL